MQPPERTPAALDPDDHARARAIDTAPVVTLEGWGMHNHASSRLLRPQQTSEIADLFAQVAASGGSIGLRGAGCSYGDAALNDAQYALDCTALNRILAWDPASGQVTVEPGVTIAQLWQRTLPDGWWPAVVPGTSVVTIGGAAASNIHGKNNWHTGSFVDHVLHFDLLLPSGATVTCSREQNRDLFLAAIGGLGLLGCFTALTLQTRRVASGLMRETQTAHASLDALLTALEAATEQPCDIVAWIDTGARGRQLGRGLLKVAHDLAPGEDPALARSLSVAGQRGGGSLLGAVPAGVLPRLARPLTSAPGVWLANRAQWSRGNLPGAATSHQTTYARANFLLDSVPEWKNAYRPGGLLQHQSFVPRAAAADLFRQLLTCSLQHGIVPSLAVLKKHRPDDTLLSYLGDGYSLALDYPVRRGEAAHTLALLHTMNDLVAAAGGRCYLAKDSTLTSAQAQAMYGSAILARFLVLKQQHDPQCLLSTDLYRRVFAPGT